MVGISVHARNRLQDSRDMKIVLISALAIVVLLSAIVPNVMAGQGYWTENDVSVPTDLDWQASWLSGHIQSHYSSLV
jgi:hypothetical protein